MHNPHFKQIDEYFFKSPFSYICDKLNSPLLYIKFCCIFVKLRINYRKIHYIRHMKRNIKLFRYTHHIIKLRNLGGQFH